MGVKLDILISVCGFPVDIECEGAICAAVDGDVEHCYSAVLLLLLSPFDVRVDAVDECEEWRYVVFVDCSECVVCLSQPK